MNETERLLEERPDDSASKSDRRAPGTIFGNVVNEHAYSAEGEKKEKIPEEIVTHCLELDCA